MTHSSKAADSRKPDKPHKTSDVLTARGDGRWCKRYKDNSGTWKWFYARGTEQEALEEWHRVKPDLLAGRDAPPKGGYLELAVLVNQFLHHKKQLLDSGELAPRTWTGYEAVGKLLVAFFGRTTSAEQLRSSDFQKLRAHLAAKYGPVALGNRIQVVRMVFGYGSKSGLLTKPAEFGVEFEKPSAKTLRQTRSAKGAQAFTAEQILALVDVAEPHMAAMILLAINGGLGNTDLALLTADRFDLECGWLDYPRAKTGVARRIPLWPETVAAVREAIAKRQPAKATADADLIFIGARGVSYIARTGGDRVAHKFKSLCDLAGVSGRVFYDLRRTFQTIADNLSRDRDGVKAIMGHAPASNDMSAIYRQSFDNDRLRAIVDAVHDWLFAEPVKGKGKASSSKAVKPAGKAQKAQAKKAPSPAAEGFQLRIVG